MSIVNSFLQFFGIENKRSKEYRHIWAIGDIQGCYQDFMALLKKIDFDPSQDQIWLAGDLVNRGQGSLETLEYLYSIKDSVVAVLGNHDITLLAAYWGLKKSNPTIDPILNSPKADKLIDWVRTLPFVHYDEKLGYIMAHAGIPPAFDLEMALSFSAKLQAKLSSNDAPRWLAKKMQDAPTIYNGTKKNRYAINAFTRMRYCDVKGVLDYDQKGKPDKKSKAAGLMPWFECPTRKKLPAKIIFGHWSTLGYIENDEVVCLDTGCIWQGKMSAKRLNSTKNEIVQIDCPDGLKP